MKYSMEKRSCLLSVLFGVLIIFYAVAIEPNIVLIKEQTIYDKELEAVLGGKTVIQISDLHINRIGFREEMLVEKINALNPDLIFITGEYLGQFKTIEAHSEKLKAAVSVIRKLKARYGVWGVLGEEDVYPGQALNNLLDALRDSNMKIMRNEGESIIIDGKRLNIIGAGIHYAEIRKAFEKAYSEAPTIVLSHFSNILQAVDALTVNLEESEDVNIQGWGWQDNAYWSKQSGDIFFEKDGPHILRVQRREDGVSVDQILLTPSHNRIPGDVSDHELCVNVKSDDIILRAKNIKDENIYGTWKKEKDNNACGGIKIVDKPDRGFKVQVPLSDPENYFDIGFHAEKLTRYHLWLRMKANRNKISSDSIYVQFSDGVDESGNEIYRISKPLISATKINIILAGNTHGGQVRLPFLGPVLNLFGKRIKYDQGLFRLGKPQLYVNRGIGWSIFPIRFMCPPEITQFVFSSI